MATEFVKRTLVDGWGTTLTVPHTSAAGNLLVLAVSVGNVNVPTDTAGNTWVKASDTADIGASSQRLGQVYYCLSADPISSVTITHASNQNYCGMLMEFSGASVYRGGAMNTGTSTAATTPALTGDMALSTCFYYSAAGSTPAAAPAGWSMIDTAARGNNFNGNAYQMVPADRDTGPSWGMGANGAQLVHVFGPATPTPTHYRKTGGTWQPCMAVRL